MYDVTATCVPRAKARAFHDLLQDGVSTISTTARQQWTDKAEKLSAFRRLPHFLNLNVSTKKGFPIIAWQPLQKRRYLPTLPRARH